MIREPPPEVDQRPFRPQLVRCGPATVAQAAPAPRPSLLSQFITCSSGQWPCLCSKQFHVPASLAGVRAVGLRFWALPPWDTAHMIPSPGRCVYVVFHVWVCVTMVVLACAGPSWPHPLGFVLPGSWRARDARSQRLAGLVAATNPGKSWRSFGLKSPSGYWCVGVSGTYNIQFTGGGAYAACGGRCLSGSTPDASRVGAGSCPG